MSVGQNELVAELVRLGYRPKRALFSDDTDGVIMRIPDGYMEIAARGPYDRTPTNWHVFAAATGFRRGSRFLDHDTLDDVVTSVLVNVGCFDLDVDPL